MSKQSAKALSRLALLVFRAQQVLSSRGDELTANWEMSSAKWKVLGAIAISEKALSAAAIGRAMGLSRQAAMKQVHQLLELGMLVQWEDPQDARAPLHGLTDKGRETYAGIMQAWNGWSGELCAGLELSKMEDACVLLEALLARLEVDGLKGVQL